MSTIHKHNVTVQVRNNFLFAIRELAEIFPKNPKHLFKKVCFADFSKETLFQFSFIASIGRIFPICLAGPDAAKSTVKKESIIEMIAIHGEKETEI